MVVNIFKIIRLLSRSGEKMLCKSFVKLCYKPGTYITTQQTHLRKPIDVEKQVSIVFHYLADEGRILDWVIVMSLIIRHINKAISENLASKYHAASMAIHSSDKNRSRNWKYGFKLLRNSGNS